MASRWRKVVASAVLGLGSVLATSAQGQTMPLSLTVVLHDDGTIPAAVLDRAKAAATTIYRQVDVQLNWWNEDRFTAQISTDDSAALSAGLIHVRLLGGSVAEQFVPAKGALGMAVSGGQLATVLLPRVANVASQSGRDLATLLGHVMAHEMGHLLLPPDSHSPTGIMAATMDLFLAEHGGLSFDRGQAAMIRARVASMSEAGNRAN